jgi:hydrogenase maturation protease
MDGKGWEKGVIMQKITIIGLGDVLRGDHGAACYVLESVAARTDSESVQFVFMGNDPRFAGGLLYSADLAIVVGTMRLSGVAGGLHIWNGRVFKQHAAWMAKEDPALRHLLIALARADLAGGFPEKLIFIWIEPQHTEGYTISKPVRGAIRSAARRIFHELHQLGLETGAEAYRLLKTPPVTVELEN